MAYIDVHSHSYYDLPDTTLVLNVFPDEPDKFRHPVSFSVGLHPWHIQEDTWENLTEKVAMLSGDARVVAIGETGLDKTIAVPYNIQCRVFEKHLALAEKKRKALILHCVRSYSEMLAYRKKSDQSLPWIFHWFNASMQTAGELLRKNCYLSFGPMLFNEQSKAFNVFREVNPDRVFFETDDAGYSIAEIYERAALIKNIPVEHLKIRIMDNFGRCFNR